LAEIENQDESIKVFWISERKSTSLPDQLSQKRGFHLSVYDYEDQLFKSIPKRRCDLILIEAGHRTVNEILATLNPLQKKTAGSFPIFICIDSILDGDQRLSLFQSGVDEIFTPPVLPDELELKIKKYARIGNLVQEKKALEIKLDKAFQYLDKFKSELKQTKSELFEERTTLNSSLKQVQQMTRQRTGFKFQIKSLKEALAQNINGFTKVLIHLVTSRVETNRGHGERVAQTCIYIGQQLDFDEKALEDLKKAAMLHESGLLFVPGEVLTKSNDTLTEYEKDLFLHYPLKGAEVLEMCDELKPVADIVKHLNENADGTGYPDGTKKRYIPLSSRILAGADLLDTLRGQPGQQLTGEFTEITGNIFRSKT
jgi:response regulator RpfG family c-di-GMP phosphodiesterase